MGLLLFSIYMVNNIGTKLMGIARTQINGNHTIHGIV